jgi:hypothetical protein
MQTGCGSKRRCRARFASMAAMPTGQIADSCVLWTGFDIAIVARSYAQLNSFLAGFAFVVINLVLDRAYRRRADGHLPDSREREHETQVGISLVCAFVGLFLTALRYSLLAGETGCALSEGRAESAEVLTAVSFAACIYMLLYAIVQFVSGTSEILAKHCVFILATLVPPICVFFVQDTLGHLALALGDPQKHQPLQPLWNLANRLAIPIPLAILIICAAVWYIGINRRRSVSPSGRIARNARTMLPYITVVVVGGAILRSVLALPYTNPAAHIGQAEAWLWVALLALALIIQSAALSLQKGVEVPFADAENKT